MLTPTVTYLGPAYPERDSATYVVPLTRHANTELEVGATDAPRRRSQRPLLNLGLVGLLTTIAMFALPAVDASAGHF
jgi:hypothetical protein